MARRMVRASTMTARKRGRREEKTAKPSVKEVYLRIQQKMIDKGRTQKRKARESFDKMKSRSRLLRQLVMERSKKVLAEARQKLTGSVRKFKRGRTQKRLTDLKIKLLKEERRGIALDVDVDGNHPDFVRVYIDMVGDLWHSGHMQFLSKVRRKAQALSQKVPYLIVGLCSDDDVAGYKRRPVLTVEERCRAAQGSRCVDMIIPDVPLVITPEFIAEHNIDYVFHGDDFAPEELAYYYRVPLEMGIMQTVPYTKGISTSEIIARIRSRDQEGLNAKKPKRLELEEGSDDSEGDSGSV